MGPLREPLLHTHTKPEIHVLTLAQKLSPLFGTLYVFQCDTVSGLNCLLGIIVVVIVVGGDTTPPHHHRRHSPTTLPQPSTVSRQETIIARIICLFVSHQNLNND